MSLSCLKNVKRAKNAPRPKAAPAVAILEVVADRSGSMSSLGPVPATGIRDFIQQHKQLPQKTKVVFSLTTFDDTATTYYDGVDLHAMPDITDEKMTEMVQPRGMTLLVDTAMKRLHSLERRLAKEIAAMPPKVRQLKPKVVAVMIIVTDGMDNKSTLFTASDLNKRITAAKAKGIEVIFMGANQDAINTGGQMGIHRGAAITFGATPAAAAAAFAATTQNVYRCTSGGSSFVPAYTQSQRQSSAAAAPLTAPAYPSFGGGRGISAPLSPPPPPPPLGRQQTVKY
tara:strand:- start:1612 stop:2466 length:855 start_codon:yes stop_codon:yes gene_type:complete